MQTIEKESKRNVLILAIMAGVMLVGYTVMAVSSISAIASL